MLGEANTIKEGAGVTSTSVSSVIRREKEASPGHVSKWSSKSIATSQALCSRWQCAQPGDIAQLTFETAHADGMELGDRFCQRD